MKFNILGIHPNDESDRFGTFLALARAAVASRAEVLDRIVQGTGALAASERELETANQRVDAEELAAVSQDSGLAVATASALQAQSDARLRIKTCKLRLVALGNERARTETQLRDTWGAILQYREELKASKLAELSGNLDTAAQAFIQAILGVLSIQRLGLLSDIEKIHCAAARRQVLTNPIKGKSYLNHLLFLDGEGQVRGLDSYLSENPCPVGQLFAGINQQIAEIGKVVEGLG